MKVLVVLKNDQEKMLKMLKEKRKTSNSTQIFREALYEYAEKIFGDDIHTRINESKQEEQK